MNILAIVALLAASHPQEPVKVMFGAISAEPEYRIALTERDMADVTDTELEENDVVVQVSVQEGKETSYDLVGEWNAIESFSKEHLRVGRYHEVMKTMEEKSAKHSHW